MAEILLTGANGQLGWELRRLMTADQCVAFTSAELDITDETAVAAMVAAVAPRVIINAAAYTNVDGAESDAEAAKRVNTNGPEYLACAAARINALLIHVSTDFVFNGDGIRPLRPDDPVAPQGVYARTKLDGERRVRESGARYVILRTAWVYSTHGRNFVKTMLRLGAEREQLRVVADQLGSPTYAADLAAAILGVAEFANPPSGVWHCTNSGQASWCEFAQEIIRLGGKQQPLKVRSVEPISSSAYPTPAVRPTYSVLDCASLAADFGVIMRPWQEALEAAFSCQDEPFANSA
ncbi:MAG TPA: dTDP-4-dehydrorhamnose reductase [Lentisphaeria bacterium]|jgi:dTDP-4-dehydrorhamnose reductase|nr:dTDP-4-dehydrorhamnose reductase [Lentisphaeria bacterium]